MAALMLHVLKINLIAAVMICITMVLASLTKRKYSSKWKYCMWLMVMVFLMIPVNLSAVSPLKLRIDRLETEGGEASETVQVSGIFRENADGEMKTDVISAGKEDSIHVLPERKVSLYEGLKVLGVVWLAGILFWGIVRALRYYFSLHSMTRWSYAVRDRRLLWIYQVQCRKKGISHPPRLLMCEGLSSPMLAGLRHTGLYLPESYYKSEELEFIFSHELSHYRRHDLWYKMLLIVVTTVYWFNPALYFMQQEAEKDIENLCDGSMVGKYSMDKRMSYGKLLLKIAAAQNHIPYLSVSLNDSKKVFKDRILYMKNLQFLRERLSLAVLLGGIMAASHILVGISVQSIPVQAEEQDSQLPDREETGRDLVSMIPVSKGQAEKREPEKTDPEEKNTDVGMSEPEEAQEHLDTEKTDASQMLSDADSNNAGKESEGAAEEQDDSSQDQTQGSVTMTGEMICVYAADWEGADFLYEGTDGNWYDMNGNQYYGNGDGSWSSPDGSVYLDYNPRANVPEDSVEQASIADESGYNTGNLYQNEDGVWQNGAGGVFSDNGDGTFTGPDGAIWYER